MPGALANRRRPPAASNDNREHSAPHSGLQAAGGHWGIGEAARPDARAIARCSRDRWEGEASRVARCGRDWEREGEARRRWALVLVDGELGEEG